MRLVCKICNRKFFYFSLPGKTARQLPTICGHRENNGKWIPNQICFIKRNLDFTKKYKRRKRKEAKIFDPYALRDTPEPKVKHRCVNILTDPITGREYRCNRITANNGANKLYCQICWNRLQEGVSEEYEEFLYDTSYVMDMA